MGEEKGEGEKEECSPVKGMLGSRLGSIALHQVLASLLTTARHLGCYLCPACLVQIGGKHAAALGIENTVILNLTGL